MRKHFLPLLVLILSVALVCAGQQLAARKTGPSREQTVKIGVTLVQVDAVVTDHHGNQVKDLTPDDFEVFEDGHRQRISNFSYINTASAEPLPVPPPVKSYEKITPYVPPPPLRPEQVRRTIALVVDDLNLSWESTVRAKQAMDRFIDQEMQPGDLVAVIRTGGGMGALQQFTSDKRQLHAAIDHIVWNFYGNGLIGAFAPIKAQQSDTANNVMPTPSNLSRLGNDDQSVADQFRQQLFAVGTLGALNYVIKGLSTLPGRKSVILLSDGFKIYYDQYRDTTVLDPLRQLADLANRASVVLYTIDPRGLEYLGLTAQDDTNGLNFQQIESRLADRRDAFYQSQEALLYLAEETGGLAHINSNDVLKGLERAVNDQSGYYLIGFVPDEKTFKPVNGTRAFHDIKVKLKKPGLHIRYHHGFYRVTDEEMHSLNQTRDEQLYSALVSPFSSGGVSVKVTSLFSNTKKAGSFVRSLIHIDARDLTFTDDRDGWHKAVIDVVAMTFGDNGSLVNSVNRTETVHARGEEYRQLLDRGLLYNLNVPIKKAGAYQLRVAIRDVSSKKVGSASQFLDIPDIGKHRLAISGIALQGLGERSRSGGAPVHGISSAGTAAPSPAVTGSTPGPPAASSLAAGAGRSSSSAPGAGRTAAASEIEGQVPSSNDSPSVRIFHPGEHLDMGFIVFNAKLDKSTRRPNLQLQLRFFRDGALVSEGTVSQFSPAQIQDPQRLGAGANVALGANMHKGHYVVQVVCNDLLASEKHRTATTWIDFDIK